MLFLQHFLASNLNCTHPQDGFISQHVWKWTSRNIFVLLFPSNEEIFLLLMRIDPLWSRLFIEKPVFPSRRLNSVIWDKICLVKVKLMYKHYILCAAHTSNKCPFLNKNLHLTWILFKMCSENWNKFLLRGNSNTVKLFWTKNVINKGVKLFSR